jgi:benzaldehyde dehydrogenase (NAD)
VVIAAENAWKGKIFSGRWQMAKGGSREVFEPATGKVLTEVGFAGAEDVREAARAAAAAQVEWANTPAEQRAAVLRRAAQLLEAHAARRRTSSCTW